jgi:hypothetical protein
MTLNPRTERVHKTQISMKNRYRPSLILTIAHKKNQIRGHNHDPQIYSDPS